MTFRYTQPIAFAVVCAFLSGPGRASAAPPASETLAITYEIRWNGEIAPDEGRVIVDAAADRARVRTVPNGEKLATAPEELGYIDYESQRTFQQASFRDGSACTVTTPFPELVSLTMTADLDTILGFVCRRATTKIRSNSLDVWYTSDADVRGTPSLALVAPDGLVLRTVRNGNYEVSAIELERGSDPVKLPSAWGDSVDAAGYRARVTRAWVTRVPVFERDRIRFDPAYFDSVRAVLGAAQAEPSHVTLESTKHDPSQVRAFANGTVIARRLVLPDMDGAMILARLVHRSRGDAYDRTGSIFLLPGGDSRFLQAFEESVAVLPPTRDRDGRTYHGIVASESYEPPIELIRFITPFGIGHFNEQVKVEGQVWGDSALYVMDLTELAPVLRGEVWIGAFVGNYDTGGHEINLELRYHPGSQVVAAEEPARGWSEPLFNTVNVLEMAGQEYSRIFEHDTLRVEFELPDGVHDVVLRYLTTGHGGWENGDEFLPKANTILLDGERITSFVPWRSDCATFRHLNPASGNFWNGIASADLSRSGWCPGTAVSPWVVPLPELSPGRHFIEVAIPAGAPEGGSFSAWNVSGVLLGEY